MPFELHVALRYLLAKRKQACEEELVVNQRHAPRLYRRVVPLTRELSGVEVGGRGPVIEWAVEMARFDERKTLDHLARAGAIEPVLAEAVARADVASAAPARRGRPRAPLPWRRASRQHRAD